MKKCLVCNKGFLENVEDIISEIKWYSFIEKGMRCTICKEEFISEKQSQKTIEIAKRLGIWGQSLKLHRKLSKTARGTILRIPMDVEKNMGIKGDENISISQIGKIKSLLRLKVK